MADDTIVFLAPENIKHLSQNEQLMLGEGIDTVSKRIGVGTEDIYLLSEKSVIRARGRKLLKVLMINRLVLYKRNISDAF